MERTDILSRRRECAAQYMGLWAIEPTWFQSAVAHLLAGLGDGFVRQMISNPTVAADVDLMKIDDNSPVQFAPSSYTPPDVAKLNAGNLPEGPDSITLVGRFDHPTFRFFSGPVRARAERKPFAFDAESGIALIELNGQLMKGESKYGGTSTIEARRQIRAATADKSVRGIMLAVDSPGGTVAGTDALAGDIRKAADAKPTRAHVEDLAASAAYWAISQTNLITASETSEIGSIGTVAVVEDSSERAEKLGVKVHVISTGAYKGMGAPGTEVTSEHLKEIAARVEGINEHFLTAVKNGRGLERKDVEAAADGRVFIAKKARQMGLIDRVMSFDDALDSLRSRLAGSRQKAETQRRRTRAKIDIEKLKG